MAKRHRLLVALVLGSRVATEIDGIRRALGSSQLGRIAPHVTLVPPTNVADDAIAGAEHVLRAAAATVAAFDVELGPPATFPHNRSVLYLAVSMPSELSSLRTALFAGPFEGRDGIEREFVPHVTLDSGPGRHVDERTLRDLSGFVTSVRIETVTLLGEHDATPGPRWVPITNYALDRGGVIGTGGLEIRVFRGSTVSPTLRDLAASWDAPIPPRPTDEPFAVAVLASEVAGIATWSEGSDATTLHSHVVAPGARGLGVGTKLLDFVEDFARSRGRRALVVAPRLVERAAAYYEGRGYRHEEPAWRRDYERLPLVRRLGPWPGDD